RRRSSYRRRTSHEMSSRSLLLSILDAWSSPSEHVDQDCRCAVCSRGAGGGGHIADTPKLGGFTPIVNSTLGCMSKKRLFDDPCGIARALNAVGERWALLVVRELVFGPKRYSDLHRGLPQMSQNVLAQRLRELE